MGVGSGEWGEGSQGSRRFSDSQFGRAAGLLVVTLVGRLWYGNRTRRIRRMAGPETDRVSDGVAKGRVPPPARPRPQR